MSKCLKKRELLTRSGAALTRLPTCKLYTQLLFIRDTVVHRKTQSNVTIDLPPPSSSFSHSSPAVSPPLSPNYFTPVSKESSRPKKAKKDAMREEQPDTYKAVIAQHLMKKMKKMTPDGHFLQSLERNSY